MLEWFAANLGTILITLVLAAVVTVIIRSMIKTKKRGGSCSCGDNCGHCPMSGKCCRNK